MQSIKNWLMAFRPKTLTACLVPIVVATALVKALHLPIDTDVVILALLASFFIQIGTNLVNDAVDFKKGADTEKRIGPQRVTQSGLFTYRQVMIGAAICFLLAVVCGVPLVMKGGTAILVIGILSVLMGYAYTMGPIPLAYFGLGDLFVILFFGLIAVMGVFFLHTHMWTFPSFWLGLQIGFHATVLIAINNLRDADQDRHVNKKTLAVRMGKSFARYEIAFLSLAPFVMNYYWWTEGFKAATLIPLLALPLALLVIKNIFQTEPSSVYNKYLGQSALLHLVFGLLLSLGFFIE
ncbi:1,4-dihydroxy-2-naphthoate octaprenyltransferase [Bdellovibrio sp. HCB337]|uniref:1,4-dihydroxy-2-naphthoate octaprenyltransferase n=1 Tax=Bdellovibrio sp. HCB337 TaxID=3394358 RepID=UPI0039A40E77